MAENRKSDLKILKRCLRNSFYYYLSGQEGKAYVNIDIGVIGDDEMSENIPQYETIKALAEEYSWKIKEIDKVNPFSRIAFIDKGGLGPVGAISLASLLIVETKKDALFIRPYRNTLRASIRGKSLKEKERILIISDVATTGESILKAAEKIWNHGSIVVGALVLYDQERGARENLALKDLKLYSLFTLSSAKAEDPDIQLNKPSDIINEFGGAM